MKRLASFIFLVMAGSTVMAQEADPASGEELYGLYCAQCHGADATGNGPMAELLAVETPDLTALSMRNDGTFPMADVARQIDGRARLLAHGGDMPVFGPFFGGEDMIVELPSGQPMAVSQPLADLLAWLETVQRQD